MPWSLTYLSVWVIQGRKGKIQIFDDHGMVRSTDISGGNLRQGNGGLWAVGGHMVRVERFSETTKESCRGVDEVREQETGAL